MRRLALLLPLLAAPQDPPDLLDAKARQAMFEAYYHRMTAPRPPQFRSKEDWEKRRKDLRARILRDLGLDPLPERVPLKPFIAAAKEYPDYRLERVWYQTWPQVWASGWLYVPKREG